MLWLPWHFLLVRASIIKDRGPLFHEVLWGAPGSGENGDEEEEEGEALQEKEEIAFENGTASSAGSLAVDLPNVPIPMRDMLDPMFVGWLLVFGSSIVGGLLNIFTFTSSDQPPVYYFLYPPFAFIRCISLIISSYSIDAIRPPGAHFWYSFLWLLGETSLFLAFLVLWPVVQWVWFVVVRHVKLKIAEKKAGTAANRALQLREDMVAGGDEADVLDEVAAEVRAILNDERSDEDYAIIIRGLTKRFGLNTVVENVHLSMKTRECFALLGPNGAGKTTLLKMLTGELTPSMGTATLAGAEILTQRGEVRRNVSVCPQFDVLWDKLTVRQHLLFYLRLRGVPYKEQAATADRLIAEVCLSEAVRKNAEALSGGMKRRLSIAIALCGNPDVVLLDEPTTGLDPNTRRGIWSVIEKIKLDKCLVLTTHAMDEAEKLCDRIAILTNGRVRCIGDLRYLKDRFSKGYQLMVMTKAQHRSRADEYIRSVIPNLTETSQIANSMYYRIPAEGLNMARLFALLMPARARQHGIVDWTLNQASLEEVFLKFATGHDAVKVVRRDGMQLLQDEEEEENIRQSEVVVKED